MTTTRERILNHIEKNYIVTSSEISKSFGVTRANIRYHLDILLNQGLIEVVGKRTSKRKGRPDLLYSISKLSKGSNLDILSIALMEELDWMSLTKKDRILRSIAAKLSISVHASGIKDLQSEDIKQLSQKLLTTIEILDKLKYRAHWEAHAEGPRIILKNCPYQQIEPQYPDICHLDKYLIEFLLKAKVNQTGKLEPNERNIPHCIFVVID